MIITSAVLRPVASIWSACAPGGRGRGGAALGPAGYVRQPSERFRCDLRAAGPRATQERLPGAAALQLSAPGSGARPALQHLHLLREARGQQQRHQSARLCSHSHT